MGFAFRYPRIIAMECDVCRWLDRPEARLLLELSPCWAAYYGRVPISTRAIALLHRCMCAAPRLIAQVTDTIFVDLSICSFLRAISREWGFLPIEILCLIISFFFGRFFWILGICERKTDDERDIIFSISCGIIKNKT